MTGITYASVFRLASKALEHGAKRPGTITLDWDVSGDCTEPKTREFFARPDHEGPKRDSWSRRLIERTVHHGGPGGDGAALRVIVTVRCRRCSACLRQRSRMWAARAKAETGLAARTWFGTLTLSQAYHARVAAEAARECAMRGQDLDALSYKDQFVWRHRIISRWLTKYLKRVRKESGSPFKYLLVAEAHKSGLPHYHMLVHEQTLDAPVRKDTLDRQWPFGFTKWRLVNDPRMATYLCKYLSKTAAARVRASGQYGSSA